MKILTNYIVSGGLKRPNGDEAQVGDTVRLYLDIIANPSLPETVEGTIVYPITSVNCGEDRAYRIEYNGDFILKPIDILDAMVLDCCALLEEGKADVDAENVANYSKQWRSSIGTDQILGGETLSLWYEKLQDTGGTGLSIMQSGDSLTANRSVMDVVMPYVENQGFLGIDLVTHAANGRTAETWIADYLEDEITEAPDLWVIGYLTNDLEGGASVDVCLGRMNTALSTIRGTLSFEDTGIIILSPPSFNSVNATPLEQELLSNGLAALAREYHCAFVDKRRLFPDFESSTYDGVHNHIGFSFAVADAVGPLVCPITLTRTLPLASSITPLVSWQLGSSDRPVRSLGSITCDLTITGGTTVEETGRQLEFDGINDTAIAASKEPWNRLHQGLPFSLLVTGESLGDNSGPGFFILSTYLTTTGVWLVRDAANGGRLQFLGQTLLLGGTLTRITAVSDGTTLTLTATNDSGQTARTSGSIPAGVAGDSQYLPQIGGINGAQFLQPMTVDEMKLWDRPVLF